VISLINLLPLLLVFAILGIFDLLGSKKISIIILLFSILLLFLLNSFSIVSGTLLALCLISSVIIVFLPKIGFGDKILIIASMFVYPAYFIWIILILAYALSIPFLSLKLKVANFFRKNKASVAFFPYLFLSTLLIYVIYTYVLLKI
jgi:hypothetical protein